MPVAAIAELAHARGALVVVDGAQAAGAIPFRFDELGADFYAVPAQKWLLGPEGMGALVVDPGAVERLDAGARPAGSASSASTARGERRLVARRPPVRGDSASTGRRSSGWPARSAGCRCSSGLDFVYRRGPAMAAAAADRLAAIPGVTVLTPRDRDGDAGHLPDRRLAGRRRRSTSSGRGSSPIARTIPSLDAIRISVGFFTTDDELERFAEAVELLAGAHARDAPAAADADDPGRGMTIGATPAALPAAAVVGGGPLAPVPQRRGRSSGPWRRA